MKNSCLILCCLLSISLAAQNRYYVHPTAQGLHNGASWADAFTNLHDALAAAQPGDEVWVAQGLYRPTSGTSRDVYFQQKSQTRLYGGFAGTENTLAERNWQQHPSVIDGDIGVPGDSTDNSTTLLYLLAPAPGTVIDGFTFQYGLANVGISQFTPGNCGGAVYITAGTSTAYPLFQNCIFYRNTTDLRGGAVYAIASPGGSIAPRFYNCVFEKNISKGGTGGAVYIAGGNALEQRGDFVNCVFRQNLSAGEGAGIFYLEGGRSDTLDIIGCVFDGNFSKSMGGGVYTSGRANGVLLRMQGCRFTGNSARIGGGFASYADGGTLKWAMVDSCHFEGNILYVPFPGITHYSSAFSFYAGEYVPNDTVSRNFVFSRCTVAKENLAALDVVLFQGNLDIHNNIYTEIKRVSYSGSSIRFHQNLITKCDSRFDLRASYEKPTLFIYNNVLYKNMSFGGGIRATPPAIYAGNAFIQNTVHDRLYSSPLSPPLEFYNNIFWGNKFAPQGDSLLPIPFDTFPAFFSHNFFDFPDCDKLHPKLICGPGNIYGSNPLFADTAAFDFRLLPCSPAIDAGDPTIYDTLGVFSDYLGLPRMANGLVDIGPVENPASPLLAAVPVVQPACPNASGSIQFAIQNGCDPFQFQWTTAGGSGSDTTALPAGDYQFTITDSRGLTITQLVTIPSVPAPEVQDSIHKASCASCADGSIALSVSGGQPPFTFQWSNDSTGAYLKGLEPGTYTVTLTDGAHCTYPAEYTVSFTSAIQNPGSTAHWQLFPNPADDYVILEYRGEEAPGQNLMLYNAMGQLVKTVPLPHHPFQIRIPLAGLPEGVYSCEVRGTSRFLGKLAVKKR